MELHVRLEGRRDLARQVYEQIRQAILGGRIPRDERLPPTRELAQRLGVSRNTVTLAYEWLTAEGLIAGRKGAGSFVESRLVPSARLSSGAAKAGGRPFWHSIQAPAVRPPPRWDFGVGMPDAEHFPFDTWRRLLARQIRGSKLRSHYGDPAGLAELRAAIARHVGVSRGVRAAADDVLVTNGAQQAFDLVARVLLSAGSVVAVEEPGYPPPRLLFASMGARVVPVPVDAEGLDVAALPAEAKLVYVTPSHQFPLGMPMSPARRHALLEWAERRQAVILEDDYDSEFRFGGRPLETLQAADRGGRVVYVGSFSKSLLPALRLGFLVAPPALRQALMAASYVASWHVQLPAQAALAAFIDSGLLARHIRKMRHLYADRHARILHTVQHGLAPWLIPQPSVTGMHLAATLRTRSVRREEALAQRALAAGVAFDRLSTYYAARPAAGLVLGYGAIPTAEIEEGLKHLRSCLAATYAPRVGR